MSKSVKVRTPWAILRKKIRCFFRGHDPVIYVGDLARKGHRMAPLHTCPYCSEILMYAADAQKFGVKPVAKLQ